MAQPVWSAQLYLVALLKPINIWGFTPVVYTIWGEKNLILPNPVHYKEESSPSYTIAWKRLTLLKALYSKTSLKKKKKKKRKKKIKKNILKALNYKIRQKVIFYSQDRKHLVFLFIKMGPKLIQSELSTTMLLTYNLNHSWPCDFLLKCFLFSWLGEPVPY